MSDQSTESGDRSQPVSRNMPGLLIHDKGAGSMEFRAKLIVYGESEFREEVFEDMDALMEAIDVKGNRWINIDGIHNKEQVTRICEFFEIHPLLTEDVMNRQHRPKCEVFPTYIFVTLRMLGLSVSKQNEIVDEQVSFVVGKDWVLSFQERRGDLFEIVRERLRSGKSKVLTASPSYLMCRLMDVIVDNYFYVNEFIREKLEYLENEAFTAQGDQFVKKIQAQKKQLIFLRKSISPLREVTATLKSEEAAHLISKSTARYFNDIYDHAIQASETVDTQREFLATIMDLNLSQISNRMNQVMQLLTTIATIFIPLTFIVGVYGMNFDHMPELHWKYAYFIVWGIMLVITLFMLRFFRRKGWI